MILGCAIGAGLPAAAGASPQEQEIEPLVRQLGAPQWELREEASRKLLDLAARDTQGLLARLPDSDPDPEIDVRLKELRRRIPAERLLRIAREAAGEDENFPQATLELVEALVEDPAEVNVEDPEQVAARNDAFSPVPVVPVRESRASPPEAVRRFAEGSRAYAGAAARILAALYADAPHKRRKDPAWRVAITQGMGILKAPAGVQTLSGMLHDEDANVRRSAVWALGQILQGVDARKDARKVEALLADPNPGVRLESARTLGLLQDPDSVPPLTRALADEDASVAREAAAAIDRIRGKKELPPAGSPELQ